MRVFTWCTFKTSLVILRSPTVYARGAKNKRNKRTWYEAQLYFVFTLFFIIKRCPLNSVFQMWNFCDNRRCNLLVIKMLQQKTIATTSARARYHVNSSALDFKMHLCGIFLFLKRLHLRLSHKFLKRKRVFQCFVWY